MKSEDFEKHKAVGEGFGLLIHMYPHSVQAGLISMKPEPIHCCP